VSSSSASGLSKLNRWDFCVLAGFLLFLVVFFFGVLAGSGERCLGQENQDARTQFYGWRAYGFGEVRAGRFPLWNPYELLGMPFVAGLQSAMFYPTNWLCAVLPLGRAINLGILLNLFLSGLFTYLWCRRVGLRWLGSIVAAGAYVFGAPQFLRIFEGHWSFLAPMPWIPCVLLCVEATASGEFRPLAIAAGGGHSLALKSDSTVVAWGVNQFGQLGVPPGLTNVVAIAAGNGPSWAVKADGTVVGSVPVSDVDATRLFQYYKMLGPKYNPSLLMHNRVAGRQSLDRMIAAAFFSCSRVRRGISPICVRYMRTGSSIRLVSTSSSSSASSRASLARIPLFPRVPNSPWVISTRATLWPSSTSFAIVPPQDNSMSSGCAPIANTSTCISIRSKVTSFGNLQLEYREGKCERQGERTVRDEGLTRPKLTTWGE
jgi:hypothetical protein